MAAGLTAVVAEAVTLAPATADDLPRLVQRGLHRLEAEVLASNEVALRTFARAGFRREGVRRAAYDRAGGWQDGVLLGLLAEELG